MALQTIKTFEAVCALCEGEGKIPPLINEIEVDSYTDTNGFKVRCMKTIVTREERICPSCKGKRLLFHVDSKSLKIQKTINLKKS